MLLSGEDDDAAHPVVFGSKLYGWHTAVTQDFRTQHYEKTVYKEKVDTATWNGYAKICKSKHPVGNVLCIQTRATAASMNIMKIPTVQCLRPCPGLESGDYCATCKDPATKLKRKRLRSEKLLTKNGWVVHLYSEQTWF